MNSASKQLCRLSALLFLLFVSSFVARASELSTNGFTFSIPTEWKFNEKAPRDLNLEFDARTNHTLVPIRFNGYSQKDKQPILDRLVRSWKQFLEKPKEAEAQMHVHQIGSHEITYIELNGTMNYFSPGAKKQIYIKDFTFFAAVVSGSQGSVSIYMHAPTQITDLLKLQFKEMVEEAVENAK